MRSLYLSHLSHLPLVMLISLSGFKYGKYLQDELVCCFFLLPFPNIKTLSSLPCFRTLCTGTVFCRSDKTGHLISLHNNNKKKDKTTKKVKTTTKNNKQKQQKQQKQQQKKKQNKNDKSKNNKRNNYSFV